MNATEMAARIKELESQNAALTKSSALSLKIGDSGGVVVSGLQQFPTTLFKDQWRRLLAFAPEIEAYIIANDNRLPTKAESLAAKNARR